MNNIGKYHFITFLQNLAFTLPIWVIFGTNYLGLTNLQAYWLGTFYWLVSTFFEIPTGSWADRIGRKKVFGLGTIIGACSLLAFALTKNFYLLLAVQLISGFAVALKSGPLDAIIFDWLKVQKREKEYYSVTSNNLTYLFIGRVVGGAIGGLTFTIHPTLPYLLAAGSHLLSWVFIKSLEETKHLTSESLSDYKIIRTAFTKLITLFKRPDYLLVLVASATFSCLANMLWYAYQPFFERLGFHANIIGLIYMPISISSAIGSQLVKRIIPKIHTGILYALMLGITSIVALGMNTLTIWFGFAAILVLSIIFGFDNPASGAYLQKFYPSKIRATMNSIESLIGSVVLVTASTTTGYFLDHFGMNKLFSLIAGLTALSALITLKYTHSLQTHTTKARF